MWLLLAGSVISFSPKDNTIPLAPSLTWKEANLQEVLRHKKDKNKFTLIKSEHLTSFIREGTRKNITHVVTSKKDLQDADDLDKQVNSSVMCCCLVPNHRSRATSCIACDEMQTNR